MTSNKYDSTAARHTTKWAAAREDKLYKTGLIRARTLSATIILVQSLARHNFVTIYGDAAQHYLIMIIKASPW